MKRIVVATDGSAGAVAAARVGGEIAKALGAEVVLAHAASIPAAMSLGLSAAPQLADEYLETTTRHAFDVAGRVLDGLGVAHRDVTLTGPAADAVVDEARRCDAELIVIGHRGLSGLERLFLGSVSDRIAHIAGRHVLVAHPTDDDRVAAESGGEAAAATGGGG